MSTIQSSAEHLTLNADGSSKDIKFQANGVEKASISSSGVTHGSSSFLDMGANHIYLADNAQVKFGTSEDLQIYHDGSNSYIRDAGTGDIHIRSDAGFRVQNANGTENYIYAEANGKVRLYYDNNTKLDTTANGIQVTDRVTGSSNLILNTSDSNEKIHLDASGYIKLETAGSERMRIDSSGNVGIGTASPSNYNSNTNNLVIRDTGNGGITISTGASNTGYLAFNDGENTTIEGLIAYNQSTDVMSFRTATVDDRLVINGSGNVGIGIASPLDILHLNDSDDDCVINLDTAQANKNSIVKFSDPDAQGRGMIQYNHTTDTLRTHVAGTERTRIHSDGVLSVPAGIALGVAASSNASSNTLNDYEEGTHNSVWTASSSGTITPYRGHMAYTKIGNMVHMTGEVEIASVSSPSGSTKFTLPYVVATAGTQRNMNFGGAGFAAYGINFHENNPPVMLAHEGNSYVQLVYQRNDSSFTDFTAAAGDTFFFSFSYKTN